MHHDDALYFMDYSRRTPAASEYDAWRWHNIASVIDAELALICR